MFLFAGLGNPGEKYASTRHNIGYWVIDALSKGIRTKNTTVKYNAAISTAFLGGEEVILAKPLTFMNRSGFAVTSIVEYYSLPLERVLVIYDDMDLPLGKLRLRPGGGSGGHRGMDSIIRMLGRDDFPRLRMGIGRDSSSEEVSFLLSPFSLEEKEVVQDMVERAAEALKAFVAEGIEMAMNRYNS